MHSKNLKVLQGGQRSGVGVSVPKRNLHRNLMIKTLGQNFITEKIELFFKLKIVEYITIFVWRFSTYGKNRSKIIDKIDQSFYHLFHI